MIRTHHFSSNLEEAKALYIWQNWMNEQEKYWIAHYGTNLSGLNQTRGGQMSYTVAMFQSKLKKNAEVWTKKDMPAFRSSDYSKRLWAIPVQQKVNGTKVGKIIKNIWTGHTSIPQMYLLEMEAMGYNGGKSTNVSRWKFDILPAFKDFSSYKQNRFGRFLRMLP
jgi:hypothetical protein